MAAIDEDLGCKGTVKTVGNVVFQLDPSERAVVHPLGIQNHKLRAVGLRHVELDYDEAIVFLSLPGALPAETWHKDGLTHTAMGVPHLTLFMLGVILARKKGCMYNIYSGTSK